MKDFGTCALVSLFFAYFSFANALLTKKTVVVDGQRGIGERVWQQYQRQLYISELALPKYLFCLLFYCAACVSFPDIDVRIPLLAKLRVNPSLMVRQCDDTTAVRRIGDKRAKRKSPLQHPVISFFVFSLNKIYNHY